MYYKHILKTFSHLKPTLQLQFNKIISSQILAGGMKPADPCSHFESV